VIWSIDIYLNDKDDNKKNLRKKPRIRASV
jgi:hypothetical protein